MINVKGRSMPVSVNTANNNNNNGLLYTAGAAGGAGLLAGAAGYLTKPYLKDGQLADEFVREVFKDVRLDFPKGIYFQHALQPKPNGVKAYYINGIINDITPENLKKAQQKGRFTAIVGLQNAECVVNEKTTVEQLKKDMKHLLENSERYNWDTIAKEDAVMRESFIDNMNKDYWDSAKKQFKKLADNAVDDQKKLLERFKSAANKKCLKTAGIWAGVAAVTVGAIGALILACSKSKAEPAPKQVNVNA